MADRLLPMGIRARLPALQLALGLALALPLAAAAIAPEDFGEAWRWRTFDRDDSLPAGPISVLGHDRDDMIYAGTVEGLFRYNGYYWSRVASAEVINPRSIRQIVESGGEVFVATTGDVWVVRGGLELHRIFSSRSFLFAVAPVGGVFAIDFAAREHLQIERGERIRVGGGPGGIPMPPGDPIDYSIDGQGMHWLSTTDGLYRRDVRKGFKWQLDPDLPPGLRGLPCRRFFLVKSQAIRRIPAAARVEVLAPRFHLWARFDKPGGEPVLARHDDAGKWIPASMGSPPPAVDDLVIDGSGNYYAVADRAALYLSRDGEAWEPVPQLGIGPVKLRSGVLDLHGYIWYAIEYANDTGKVARFDPESRRWERSPAGRGEPARNVLSLLEASDGSIWAGTESGLQRYRGGRTEEFTAIGRIPIQRVTGLAEDTSGKIWISSATAFPGTYYHYEDTWFQYRQAGISEQPVRRIAAGRRGELWFLTADKVPETGGYRVYHYSASPYTVSGRPRPIDIPRGPVNDFIQAQDGSYWAATEEGLVHLVGGSRQVYTEKDGLRSARVWAVVEHPTDGHVWICYGGSGFGVTRVRGEDVEHFDVRDRAGSPVVWSITTTQSIASGASVWLGTDSGLSRFDGDCWYHYTVASLEPSASRVWPVISSRFEDDSVLLGTFGHGVFRFRQDDHRRPQFLRDSFSMARDPDGGYRFAWEARDFKQQTSPRELLHRYRIDDGVWSPFAPQNSAVIRDLEPGLHSLQVEIRDLDGNANREPVQMRFHVAPPWPIPPAVIGLLAVGGILGAALLVVAGVLLFARIRYPVLRFRGVFQGLQQPALVFGPEGRIVDYNGARPELLGLEGLTARRLLGLPASAVPGLQGGEAQAAIDRALEGTPADCELRDAPPGSGRVLYYRTMPLRRGPEGAVFGAALIVEDASDSARRREQAERQRRLGAVRDLSGRLGEKLEQAIGGMRRALSRLETATGSAGREEIESLRAGAQEAEAVVRSLEEFSRQEPPPRREEVSPLGLVEELLRPSANGGLALSGSIAVDLRGQAGLWSIAAERDAVRSAIGEVIRNAADAMPGGGKITIRLANRRLDRAEESLPPGRYVEITVSDLGPGMDRNQIEQVFDPLYSTKARDRHRGLGLSTAHGVMRRHGGGIRIESRPAAGTQVMIYLPAAGG